jgi:hypothetical protein
MAQKVVTNDEAVTGSKIFVLPIFGTFGRYITNLRGTFVENVKKVENQPTLLHIVNCIYTSGTSIFGSSYNNLIQNENKFLRSKYIVNVLLPLKGQSQENVGDIRVCDVSLGPNEEQLLVFKFF